MAKRIHRASSAQEIMESGMSTRKMVSEYNRLSKMANARLERLERAGLESSEFYQEHKAGFGPLDTIFRKNIAKELAELNRFLNAQSSTISGLRKSREDLIDVMNKRFGDGETGPFNEENIDRFSRFMKEYRDKYKEQLNLASDKAVDLFLAKERLQLSEKDLWRNVDTFLDYEEELASMSVEDVLGRRKNVGQRFKISTYLKAFGL